jgi:hypothetical protein
MIHRKKECGFPKQIPQQQPTVRGHLSHPLEGVLKMLTLRYKPHFLSGKTLTWNTVEAATFISDATFYITTEL